MRKIEIKKRIFKTNLAIILVAVFIFGFSNNAKAGWPVNNILEVPGVGLDDALETVRSQTQNYLLSKMQQEAIKQIRQTMAELVTGGHTSESFVITDYGDFIYGVSSRRGEVVMAQFFRQLNEGVSDGEREILRSVEQQLKHELFPKEPMKQTIGAVTSSTDPYQDVFLDNETRQFTMDNYLQVQNSGVDHPADIYQNVKAGIISYMTQQQDIQRTIAIANQGFIPQNGIPGSVISQVVAATETAPIEMIANAVSVQQVVDNISTSTLTAFMERGYGIFSAPAANQAARVGQSVEGGVQTVQDLIYQGNHELPN